MQIGALPGQLIELTLAFTGSCVFSGLVRNLHASNDAYLCVRFTKASKSESRRKGTRREGIHRKKISLR